MRERVDEDGDRIGVGQTVPEAAVADQYRRLMTHKAAQKMDEKWLVHMPAAQLEELVALYQA